MLFSFSVRDLKTKFLFCQQSLSVYSNRRSSLQCTHKKKFFYRCTRLKQFEGKGGINEIRTFVTQSQSFVNFKIKDTNSLFVSGTFSTLWFFHITRNEGEKKLSREIRFSLERETRSEKWVPVVTWGKDAIAAKVIKKEEGIRGGSRFSSGCPLKLPYAFSLSRLRPTTRKGNEICPNLLNYSRKINKENTTLITKTKYVWLKRQILLNCEFRKKV